MTAYPEFSIENLRCFSPFLVLLLDNVTKLSLVLFPGMG